MEAANRVTKAGGFLLRYGLVLVLGWIGLMKFWQFEAEGIQPLIASSPFMSWMYKLLSVQGVSNVIGVTELITAALIALGTKFPRLSAAGSALAIPTFLATLSFLFTLPGWHPEFGFPILGGAGGFLVKDVILLGAALWTLGESLAAVQGQDA